MARQRGHPALTARASAARILAAVIHGGVTLDEALPRYRESPVSARDRAFVQELCYGTLRWYFRLRFFADRLLDRPLRRKDAEVNAVLLCGLYQMSSMRTPDHAAVSESVEVVKELGRPGSASLVNAVLRRFQREQAGMIKQAEADPVARCAHPGWLLDALRREWPDHWEHIVDAGNRRPPMHLRVNRRKGSVEDFVRRLADSGIEAARLPDTEAGVRLAQPTDVETLPGFAEGLVSVQDAGAQLAAGILDPQPGHRVLDACAAPGGKTCHILEREPRLGELVAVDHDPARLALVTANLARLGLAARTICADAAQPEWHAGPAFDRVLLDVPCSATGVIRRHPDIKVLRRPGQIRRYAATQDALLAANWPLLVRGGRMLYATCSLLREENDARIEKFRKNNKDVRILKVAGPGGVATGAGRQTVPGLADTDGFYYALLEKS
ncbi:MAG TPA: 16S rRNA (cytosine(967)-C(5))-methyltransferase RsmB [Gammaproteobacteria bacterium]